MKNILIILSLVSVSVFAQTSVTTLQGVYGGEENGKAIFKSGKYNYKIDLSKIDPETKKKLKPGISQKKAFTIKVKPIAITEKKKVPFGLRATCDEIPFDVDGLAKIASDPKVKGINDFLKQIPDGTMQSFTLVTTSESAQKGSGDSKVRPEWPRVLRSSIDGKTTFSYTCDPRSEAYNKVEVIYYDDNKSELKTLSLDLKAPLGSGPEKRVHHNPKSCVECHSNGEINGKPHIKHNWQEYFFWGDCKEGRGTTVYGMSDDNMTPDNYRSRSASHESLKSKDCNYSNDEAAFKKQIAEFKNFKTKQKDNPCYALLPWPEAPKDPKEVDELGMSFKDHELYPYSKEAQKKYNSKGGSDIFDYRQRTNLRFNDTYGHLTGNRVAKVITDNKDYQKIKYLVLMKKLSCIPYSEVEKGVKSILPEYKLNSNIDDIEEDPKTDQLLFYVGAHAGLKPGDWTMNFNNKDVSSYRAAIVGESYGDIQVADLVYGDLLKEAVKGVDPSIMKKIAPQGLTSQGVKKQFGSQFSCLDDLGGSIKPSIRYNPDEMCRVLKDLHAKNLASMSQDKTCKDCDKLKNAKPIPNDVPEKETTNKYSDFLASMDKITDKVLQESVKRGEKLVHDSTFGCIKCHSADDKSDFTSPDPFSFIPNKNAGKKAQEASAKMWIQKNKGKSFFDEIKKLIENKEMPATGADQLTAKDREDLINYLANMTKNLK